MIKTVIFDLGKVLIPFDFSRGYRAMESFCDYPAAEIPKRISTTDLVHRFETGLVEPHDFVEQLSRILDLRVTYDQFCYIWSSIFLPDELVPESMLAGIAERYRLLVLSNTNAIHFAMVRRNYPLLRHFDDLVLSYEVKAMKPSPVIYREAIARAQCRPEECFFTDDIPAYVEAARREGIDAVQFTSCGQLQQELAGQRDPLVMITDLVQIRLLGEKKRAENERFRRHMKAHDHSDRILRRIAEGIEAEIDCTVCANCCRVATVKLSERDVERLARNLRLTPAAFLAEYTAESEEEGTILRRTDAAGCVFLEGNACTVYDARPDTCQRFPHVVRGNGSIASRMWQFIDRACYCPIVYNALEAFKTETRFRR